MCFQFPFDSNYFPIPKCFQTGAHVGDSRSPPSFILSYKKVYVKFQYNLTHFYHHGKLIVDQHSLI